MQIAAVRALSTIPLLLLSSVAVFLLVATAGDPLADLRQQPEITAERLEAERQRLGLDRPVLDRYATWLRGALRGQLGETVDGREVGSLLRQRLAVTLRLVAAALAFGVVLALFIGTLSAMRSYGGLDIGFTVASLAVLSLPVYWLAGLLKQVLAVRLNDLFGWPIVYTLGEVSPNLKGGLLERWADYAGHLVLPTIVLAVVLSAAWSRYLRASMIEGLARPHVDAARAKGLSTARLVVRHGLRNSLVPFCSVVAVDFGAVLGGSVIVEQVFEWQGMGRLLLDGIERADTNVVQAWLLASAVLVVTCNFLADLLIARLDPRARAL